MDLIRRLWKQREADSQPGGIPPSGPSPEEQDIFGAEHEKYKEALLEEALAAYKVWLEQPTGPGLIELNEQVRQAGFVRPGGGLDFDSFMAIAVDRGIRKPYRAPQTPTDALRRGPRGGYFTYERSRVSGKTYKRYR